MTTIYPLPTIEIMPLSQVKESRPTALLTGQRSWAAASGLLELPIVVQAEPRRSDQAFIDNLAANLPAEVEVVYGVGGGLVSDLAKYLAWARQLPCVIVPTALSVDGFFTGLAAVRQDGAVHYVNTGPASKVIVDWDVIRNAPKNVRGAAVLELLTIVTGLLDWRYAAERNKTTPDTHFVTWAAGLAAGIAQQAFKIAAGIGQGNVEALTNLLDLVCMEVQLNNQLGHNRAQEGSEQFFAYAYEAHNGGLALPYADVVGPGLLIAAALHGQDIAPMRATLTAAGVRLGQLRPDDILETINILPEYVKKHDFPYTILNDLDLTSERVQSLISTTGLDVSGTRPL
jgi:glycerol-1-phosphate dehydrogenase [NAD(P)+]